VSNGSTDLRDELVADARNRDDELVIGGMFAQCPPDGADVNSEVALLDGSAAPDGIQDLALFYGPSVAQDEQFENVEGLGRKSNDLTPAIEKTPGNIEPERPKRKVNRAHGPDTGS
jgi:hypothetical protein